MAKKKRIMTRAGLRWEQRGPGHWMAAGNNGVWSIAQSKVGGEWSAHYTCAGVCMPHGSMVSMMGRGQTIAKAMIAAAQATEAARGLVYQDFRAVN
jgi:hypothetical protein